MVILVVFRKHRLTPTLSTSEVEPVVVIIALDIFTYAMCLAKELTNHSLPEIGDAFGGRDHTTVMHACKQIANLRQSSIDIEEDYNNLLRLLSS